MSRFTKTKFLNFLQVRLDGFIGRNKLDPHNGHAQLGYKTFREEQLVLKAIAYGKMRELETLKGMVEGNHPLIVEKDL